MIPDQAAVRTTIPSTTAASAATRAAAPAYANGDGWGSPNSRVAAIRPPTTTRTAQSALSPAGRLAGREPWPGSRARIRANAPSAQAPATK